MTYFELGMRNEGGKSRKKKLKNSWACRFRQILGFTDWDDREWGSWIMLPQTNFQLIDIREKIKLKGQIPFIHI
jgi:hypothetical protein